MAPRKLSRAFLLFILFSNAVSAQQGELHLPDTDIKSKGAKYRDQEDFYKAHTYFLEQNWDSALVYSMKQLTLKNNRELADYCHYFRAYSFMNKKLLDEALKEFGLISEDFKLYYKVRLYTGEVLLMQGKPKAALPLFESIIKLSTEQYDFNVGAVYHNIGLCYMHLNDYGKAKEYLDKGFEVLTAEKDTIAIIGAYMNIGNLYYEQYKDELAKPYFKKAYDLSKKIKSFETKQNTALNMAIVAENSNDMTSALMYRKEFEQWKDSLTDQNKVWDVAELEKKFTVRQKEKEIAVLEAENKLKIAERNGLFYTSVLLLLLVGTATYLYRQKTRSNRIILEQKNKLDELNATKDQLFSIVSHDLRSSVSALKMSNNKLLVNLENRNYGELDKLLHTNSAIAHATYNLLDNLLHWALLQTKQMYFHKEDLHLFSIIQQIEFNYKPLMADKDITFQNTVPKSVFIEADQNSLKIILRNLLDNAIKFTGTGGMIKISADAHDDYCNLIIEDNGAGMCSKTRDGLLSDTSVGSKRESGQSGSGLGMQLCRSMVKKNGGKLFIDSEEHKGTKIIIQLLKAKSHE